MGNGGFLYPAELQEGAGPLSFKGSRCLKLQNMSQLLKLVFEIKYLCDFQPWKVLYKIDLETAANISILVEKYEMVHVVEAFIAGGSLI